MFSIITKSMITLALVVFLMVLQLRIWGPNDSTRFELTAQSVKKQELHARIEAYQERNAQLVKEIQTFRDDPNAIEARARRDLGMIRNGETFFLYAQ